MSDTPPAIRAYEITKRLPNGSVECQYLRMLLRAKARGILVGVRRDAGLVSDLNDWEAAMLVPSHHTRRSDVTVSAIKRARGRVNERDKGPLIRHVGHRKGKDTYALVRPEKAAHRDDSDEAPSTDEQTRQQALL